MSGYECTESSLSLQDGTNNTGSDIADKRLVMIDPVASGSFPPLVKLPTSAIVPIYGVTRGVLKNGQVGSIGVGGKLICCAAVAINPGERCYSAGASGKVTNVAPGAGANLAYVGESKSAAGIDGDIEVFMATPGSMQQGA